jgi:hypothetical protein
MIVIASTAAGFILGLVYFTMLCRGVRRAIRSPRWAMLLAAGRLARLALFAVVFVAVAHGSIAQGLAMLGGFWAGRWCVVTRLGGSGHGQ